LHNPSAAAVAGENLPGPEQGPGIEMSRDCLCARRPAFPEWAFEYTLGAIRQQTFAHNIEIVLLRAQDTDENRTKQKIRGSKTVPAL